MRPKLTENSESQPNKSKTINLLERGSYKWTTKPRKIKLEMDWVQIDRIRHTNSTKYLPRTNSRTKCSYIDHFFCLQSVFLSPLFFSIFHTLFLWRKFPYIVPSITSQPSACSISRKSFRCLSHQGLFGDNRKGCELEKHYSIVISP